MLKNYQSFKESKIDKSVRRGKLRITRKMIFNGKLIKSEMPIELRGEHANFECTNQNLTSLIGCPKYVGGAFFCYNNKLKNLKGFPEKIGRFIMLNNNQLTSLEGLPKEVNSLDCSYNQLTSLEYCPLLLDDVEQLKCEGNIFDLAVEHDFIISGKCISTEPKQYWQDLLKWMIDEKINIDKVKGWPNKFIKSLDDYHKNLFKSSIAISKFNL